MLTKNDTLICMKDIINHFVIRFFLISCSNTPQPPIVLLRSPLHANTEHVLYFFENVIQVMHCISMHINEYCISNMSVSSHTALLFSGVTL